MGAVYSFLTIFFGLNFKIHHQGLAPDDGAGIEEGGGRSTNFAFDVGYLKKFNKIIIK